MSEQVLNQILAAILALDTKVSALDTKVSALDTKVSALDTKVTALDTKVTALDTKVTALDTKVTALDTKVTALDTNFSSRLESIEAKVRALLAANANEQVRIINSMKANVAALQPFKFDRDGNDWPERVMQPPTLLDLPGSIHLELSSEDEDDTVAVRKKNRINSSSKSSGLTLYLPSGRGQKRSFSRHNEDGVEEIVD
jgi:phage shock protein A